MLDRKLTAGVVARPFCFCPFQRDYFTAGRIFNDTQTLTWIIVFGGPRNFPEIYYVLAYTDF